MRVDFGCFGRSGKLNQFSPRIHQMNDLPIGINFYKLHEVHSMNERSKRKISIQVKSDERLRVE